jgi:beta-glucuronidase
MILLALLVAVSANVHGQETYAQIINVESRNTVSLDGEWKFLPDQQCIGLYYSNMIRKRPERSYFADQSYYDDPTVLVEYSFDRSDDIVVPGDWNTQNPDLMYYEGYA